MPHDSDIVFNDKNFIDNQNQLILNFKAPDARLPESESDQTYAKDYFNGFLLSYMTGLQVRLRAGSFIGNTVTPGTNNDFFKFFNSSESDVNGFFNLPNALGQLINSSVTVPGTRLDTFDDLFLVLDKVVQAINTGEITQLGTGEVDIEVVSNSNDNELIRKAVLASFIFSYRAILGLGVPDQSNIINVDLHNLTQTDVDDFFDAVTNTSSLNPEWTVLENKLAARSPPQTFNIEEQFLKSFNHFLATYPYNTDGSIGTYNDFFENWFEYMSVTAQIEDSTSESVITQQIPLPGGGFVIITLPDNNVPDLPAYRAIYDSFFPDGDFDQRLVDFYDDVIAKEGFFLPSHNIDEWFETLRVEYLQSHAIVGFDKINTVGDEEATRRVLVIDRVLRLLAEMIDILQRISAIQADRLRFLIAWQDAYTNQLTDIPIITSGDKTPLAGSFTGQSAELLSQQSENRSEVNSVFQQITEQVRARRGAVQDESKQLQSIINQSQDAANQQAQIATSILQQLSTIISAIYR